MLNVDFNFLVLNTLSNGFTFVSKVANKAISQFMTLSWHLET